MSATAVRRSRARLTAMLGEYYPVTCSDITKTPCLHPEDFWWRVHSSDEWLDSHVGAAIFGAALRGHLAVCPTCLFYALGRYAEQTLRVLPRAPGLRRG